MSPLPASLAAAVVCFAPILFRHHPTVIDTSMAQSAKCIKYWMLQHHKLVGRRDSFNRIICWPVYQRSRFAQVLRTRHNSWLPSFLVRCAAESQAGGKAPLLPAHAHWAAADALPHGEDPDGAPEVIVAGPTVGVQADDLSARACHGCGCWRNVCGCLGTWWAAAVAVRSCAVYNMLLRANPMSAHCFVAQSQIHQHTSL